MDHGAVAELLGNYGEFIGAIAVVATLVYLTFQVKQSTSAIRQQSYHNLLQRRSAWFEAPARDRELMDLFGRGTNGDAMDALDAARFTFLAVTYLGHVQDCYLQYRAGIVERSVWEAELRIANASFNSSGYQAWWKVGKQFFLPEFIEAMEEGNTPTALVLYDPDSNEWFTGRDFPTIEGA